MAMADKIRFLLIKRKTTARELAGSLKISPQNLSNRLHDDDFSEKELNEIANILNCTFEGSFTLNDTGEKI